MRDYILLIATCFFVAGGGVFNGIFTRKYAAYRGVSAYCTMLYMIAALLGWGILYALHFSFQPAVLLYSVLFGICFAGANVAFVLAIKNGPVSLSNLILQLALIATALWGLVFWGAKWSLTVGAGLLLVVAALILIMVQKGKGEKITLKWALFSFISFLFNAGCAISQKSQVLAYEGQHGIMMMFFGIVFATLLVAVWCMIACPEKPMKLLKEGGWAPFLSGATNALHNLIIITLAGGVLSPSLIYPTIAVGGIGINTIASCLLLKERLSARQWMGIALGAAAAVLLSV